MMHRGRTRPSSSLPHRSKRSYTDGQTPSASSASSAPSGSSSCRTAQVGGMIVIGLILGCVVGCFVLAYRVVSDNINKQVQLQQDVQKWQDVRQGHESLGSGIQVPKPSFDQCAFRSYPPNRYYGLLSQTPPKFLSEASYIRGQWPVVINPPGNDDKMTPPKKVCLDTSSWETTLHPDGTQRWPFTDGHNPSVVSLSPNPYQSNQDHVRLDPTHIEPITSSFSSIPMDSLFLSVSIFGNGQCKWGMSPQQVDTLRFSTHGQPPNGKRTVIALLTHPAGTQFRTLTQTTLLLELDAKYGTTRKSLSARPRRPSKYDAAAASSSEPRFARIQHEFDDPRLFFHDGKLWVLYRNGPLFGYHDQIHNPIHFEHVGGAGSDGDAKFIAYVKASETVTVCCGRNIALISEELMETPNAGEKAEWMPNPTLRALTWVDPVTVVEVPIDDGPRTKQRRLRDLTASEKHPKGVNDAKQELKTIHPTHINSIIDSPPQTNTSSQHRRLRDQTLKSNIHGTNGYMVPLTSTGELLGIAHFHRPEHREESEYALHGHHYTHAFFTISRRPATHQDSTRPFQLKRISNEFTFRSLSSPFAQEKSPNETILPDADIIQFASGLDLIGSDIGDGRLIISYGINDCEGAVLTLSMGVVQSMLIEVQPEQEVIDLLKPLSS